MGNFDHSVNVGWELLVLPQAGEYTLVVVSLCTALAVLATLHITATEQPYSNKASLILQANMASSSATTSFNLVVL